MFQKGDPLIESRTERKFDRQGARERIRQMERLSRETGVSGMIAMVANSLGEMKTYVDFFVSVTEMPFAIDIWAEKKRLSAAHYIAQLGLQDRLLYNSITPWDKDIGGQVAELKDLGIKHVVIQVFDVDDKRPSGRLKSLQRMLPFVEKGNFKSILVDTAVMNLPAMTFSLVANCLIKQKFGLPVGCAPSNGTYMWRKSIDTGDRSRFVAVDASMHAIAALGSDFIFYGPMSGTDRVFPAVAAATCLLTTLAYEEGTPLPSGGSPLNLLFPEVVERLKEEGV
jgi:tetrahydromethanopterin S-methyltransferase subunit H